MHFKTFREPKNQTMVPSLGYTGFITNLLFRATQRLERMLSPVTNFKKNYGPFLRMVFQGFFQALCHTTVFMLQIEFVKG